MTVLKILKKEEQYTETQGTVGFWSKKQKLCCAVKVESVKQCKELRDCSVMVLVTDDVVLQDGEVASCSADKMESLRTCENKAHSGGMLLLRAHA